MHVETAPTSSVPRFEPMGVEARHVMNREPTTAQEWKRLAQSLKPARPQDYPQIDADQFKEFRRDVLKYASGRDMLWWYVIGLLLVLVLWLVIPTLIGPDQGILIGIAMTVLALATPVVAGVVHRNRRSETIAMGWAIGFFKLP